jgi:predicted nuclease of predicted toxin-antitoxin system
MATTEKANLPPKLVGRLATLFPDSDFLGLAEERGTPPKVVRLDNCSYRTARVEDLLRRNAVRISELEYSPRPVPTIRNT